MIVYIDGVDGSGKSTLRDNIAKYLTDKRIPVDKFAERLINTKVGPNRVDFLHLLNELTHMLNDETKVYILDRGPISDVIYRTFDEHEPVIDLRSLIEFLDEKLYYRNLMIVHCDTDESELRMLERGDDNPVALNRHKEIRYLYQQIMPLFSNGSYDYHVYDYTKDSWEELAKNVEEVLKCL